MKALQRRPGDIRFIMCAAIIVLPFFANAPALLGAVNADPALGISGLGINVTPALVPQGSPDFLDGATGGVMQPLAELSANDWLHGIVPWWNPYTGVGMPLAAEMVGQSFFLPLVFLFKLKLGCIWFRIALELSSGLTMFALLDRLKLHRAACLIGAVLYEFNSSFFMFPQGVGPLPFLPLLLLGIEHAAASATQGRRFGGAWVGFSIAYSIYAGFPEVAYINGMLAGAWTIWRFFGLAHKMRGKFALIIASQILLGVGMALPLLLPFHQYVALSFLGAHAERFAQSVVDPKTWLMLLLPYVYGPIGGQIGGYHVFGWLGLPACWLAITGVITSGRHRGMAFILSGYIAFWMLRCEGFPPAIWVVNLIPLMAHVNVIRFCWPSISAALFVLAAVGLDSWLARGPLGRGAMMKSLMIVSIMIVVALAGGLDTLLAWRVFHASFSVYFAITLTLYSVAVTAIILWLQSKAPTRRVVTMLTVLVILDPFASAFAPQLSTPRGGLLDLAPVEFLQQQLGTGRIFSLGAFNQDYPASYSLAGINSYALPVSNDWVTYIHQHLDAHASGVFFDGIEWNSSVDSPVAAFGDNIQNYLDIGTKFVLVPAGLNPIEQRETMAVDETDGAMITLQPGQAFSGNIPAGSVHLSAISSVEVRIGTYFSHASGPLSVRLCQAEQCTVGQIDLAGAFDDQFNQITLNHALRVTSKLPLQYEFMHPAGQPVAIWQGTIPWLRFDLRRTDISARLAFHDDLIDIYEVFGGRAFYSSTPDCALTTVDLNHVIANCLAPATLLRLEAWYPGWHVMVNGQEAVPNRSHEIFQSVELPAGQSTVDFFYIPDGMRYAVGSAIVAFLIWFGLVWQAKDGRKPGIFVWRSSWRLLPASGNPD